MASHNQFQWSLQPLIICANVLGIPINVSRSNKRIVLLVTLVGCGIIASNLVLNGPRGIDVSRLDWMQDVAKFNNPWAYFKVNPFGIIKLVKIISEMIFFCYVPVLHLTLTAMFLRSHQWKKFVVFLDTIQREMKLSQEFHRKCRMRCFLGVFYLILVRTFNKNCLSK